MANVEINNLYEAYDDILAELEACEQDLDFNTEASRLARAYDLPLILVRAMGRGLLTRDRAESADFIRTYLGGVDPKSDEYEIRAGWLSDFLDVSRGSIGATLAHRKIKKDRAIKSPPLKSTSEPKLKRKTQTAVENVLSDSDKFLIYTYVTSATNAEDKKLKRAEAAEMFGIKPESVPGIMAWVTRSIRDLTDDKLIEIELDPLVDQTSMRHGEAPNEPITSVPVATSERAFLRPAESSDGAHIEYDNVIKNKWREAVTGCIAEHIPEHKRAKMKVLCLPGRDWVEVTQIYLALGFKPEHIYGVEREAAVINAFETRAAALGCKAFHATLDEFIADNDVEFDFVSLDFLGPLGDDKFNILKALKLSKKAYVLVNYMAQREKSGLQQSYAFRDDLETRNKGVETLLGTLDVGAVVEHHGTEFSLPEQRSVESQNTLRRALGGLGKFDREKYMLAVERIMGRLVETGKVDEVVQFMLDKINQERASISKEVGNGALNQEFEARVKDPNFKTEVLAQPMFLINYIRYVLHKNLSLPLSEIRKYLNFEHTPEMQVAPQIIEGAIADIIAGQLMPIWQTFVTGTSKQTEVVGAWDYKAYRNRFHSDLIAVEDSRALKQWQNNKSVKQLVGLAFKIMTADLKGSPIQLGSTVARQAIRGGNLTDIPPAMVIMVEDVSVRLPGDLLKKLLLKLQNVQKPALDRTPIS
jgi:hypothetical protein